MPTGPNNPTPGERHVDAVLTNFSEAFMQDANDFVADKVFPIVSVQKQSDIYYKYNREDFWRDEAQRRAPGTESAGGGYSVSTDTYFCHKWAFHVDVTDDDRANEDSVLDGNRDAQEVVDLKLLIRREKLWIDRYFKAGVWATDIAGVAGAPGAGQVLQWNDAASTPIEDLDIQKLAIRQLTGKMPNTLVVGPQVFRHLKNHPDILDRIKYTQKGLITEDLLAGMFGVQKFLVAYAIENTAPSGADADYQFLFGKSALLCYAAESPGLKKPSAGYIFAWQGLLGANAFGGRIKNIRMEHIESDRIEGEMSIDMKLTSADLGVFFNTVVA